MKYFTKAQLAMLAVACLYILLPADVIPEMVLGPLGLVDDAAAFAVIVSIVAAARRAAMPSEMPRTTVTIDGETVPPAAR